MIFVKKWKRRHYAAVRAIRYAKRPHMVYDAINQRVSQLISSVTKSRSGHEFLRAYVQKYRTPASARARERENFWFQFSGLWPYYLLSLSSGNGDISREEAREEEKEARLLDGFCDSSHFHERSAEFIIGVTSPAHFVCASSPPLIYTSLIIAPPNLGL